MAFILKNFGTLGGQIGRGTKFQLFSYKTADSYIDVLGSGYFNSIASKVSSTDQIWIHYTGADATEPKDYVVRVVTSSSLGVVVVEAGLGSQWKRDPVSGTLAPFVDGDTVSTGSGDLFVGGVSNFTGDATFEADIIGELLTASKIVHTGTSKELVSIDINTAYNKNFGINNDDVPIIYSTLASDSIVETNADSELITVTKKTAYNKDFTTSDPLGDADVASQGVAETVSRSDHQHPKINATTTVVGQVELATNTETQTGTDTSRAITPAGLSSRTATTARTGLSEIATQAEVDAGVDNERYITPLTLANTSLSAGLNTGVIYGMVASNNSADSDHDIDFSVGYARDASDAYDIDLTSSITKQADATWASGTNAGGMPAGVSALFNSVMSNNTTPAGWVASASQEGNPAWNAFDRSDSTAWASTGTGNQYLQLQMPSSYVVNKYAIRAGTTSNRAPQDWTLEASDTGAFAGEEVVLDTVTGETGWGSGEVREFSFTNSTGYAYYRLAISDNNGGGTYVVVQLNFFGEAMPVNGTLHSFVLYNSTTGSTDAGFDISADASALLADSNVVSAGFDKYRRVGSVITDASANIIAFTAYEKAGGGVEVDYNEYILSFTGNYAANTDQALDIPIGIDLYARISGKIPGASTANVAFIPKTMPDFTVNANLRNGSQYGGDIGSDSASIEKYVKTDTLGEIRVLRSGLSPICDLWTLGFIDERIS